MAGPWRRSHGSCHQVTLNCGGKVEVEKKTHKKKMQNVLVISFILCLKRIVQAIFFTAMLG